MDLKFDIKDWYTLLIKIVKVFHSLAKCLNRTSGTFRLNLFPNFLEGGRIFAMGYLYSCFGNKFNQVCLELSWFKVFTQRNPMEHVTLAFFFVILDIFKELTFSI